MTRSEVIEQTYNTLFAATAKKDENHVKKVIEATREYEKRELRRIHEQDVATDDLIAAGRY